MTRILNRIKQWLYARKRAAWRRKMGIPDHHKRGRWAA